MSAPRSGTFSGSLNAGTYWLNLSNAVVNDGDPVYWDENSGQSSASQNTVGSIPSEAFTLLGGGTSSTSREHQQQQHQQLDS